MVSGSIASGPSSGLKDTVIQLWVCRSSMTGPVEEGSGEIGPWTTPPWSIAVSRLSRFFFLLLHRSESVPLSPANAGHGSDEISASCVLGLE